MIIFYNTRVLILLVMLLSSSISFAQKEEEKPKKWEKFGLSKIIGTEKSPIKLKPQITLFKQGLVSGEEDANWQFGGKADIKININFEKLRLWKGFGMVSHIEYNFGKSVNNINRSLIPINTALLFPGISGTDRFDVSSLYFTQKFGENKFLLIGKINMIDIASGSTFMGGAGTESFTSIAFVAPPSGIVPPYILGAIFKLNGKKINYTFSLYDPVSTANRSGFEHPFNEGVSLFANVELPIKIAGKSGSHAIKFAYSSQDGQDLYTLGDVGLPPNVEPSNLKKNRFFFDYTFHQYLIQNPKNDEIGWGLFGKVAISDRNPNPIGWSMLLGIGGTSFFKKRVNDNWGLGYYHYSLSSGVVSSGANLGLALRPENGLEMFYNYAVAPWWTISLHYHWINPVDKSYKSGNYIGVRTNILF